MGMVRLGLGAAALWLALTAAAVSAEAPEPQARPSETSSAESGGGEGGAEAEAQVVLSARNPPGEAVLPDAVPRPMGRAAARAADRRCTADGRHCIARSSYVADVCRTIAAVADEHGLDTGFFARLVWKESLFDAAAVSPAGAQGIAQFMPGTAALRGLKDAFNPAEALAASAHYLAELTETFGNIGLAAVAYNGGEARAERFVARAGGLPGETRAYVASITGHPAETWRDAPPATLDLALAPDRPFEEACIAQAGSRAVREFRTAPVVLPWGVIIASNATRDGAARQVARLQNRHAAVLRGEAVDYLPLRRPGMARSLQSARIGRASRAEADALCQRLRAAGGDCMVLRQ
jgi:soluble lytic murein transglycosylase-like protein